MAGDLFNLGFSNNAPPPIPGGYGNPTGMNTGGNKGPSANAGIFSGGDFANLSSGLFGKDTPYSQNIYNMLGKSYGKGTGQVLGDILSKGLFNPDVAAALLNSMQPGINRGQADILNAFGAGGNRFSSSAALSLGDYNSQVQLNQGQILANLFQNAQGEELQLLQGLLPNIAKERANEGGWMGKVLGGLEIAGGLIGAPFTGGASLGLVGSGIHQISGSGKESSSGGDSISALLKSLGLGGDSGGAGFGESLGMPTSLAQPNSDLSSIISQLFTGQQQNQQIQSAGQAFGGSAYNSSDNQSNQFDLSVPFF